MSRQQVCNAIAERHPDRRPLDQASLHKWETGALPLRVHDLRTLSEVYGYPAELLLSPPLRSQRTGALARAIHIVRVAPAELLEQWLANGEILSLRKSGRHVGAKPRMSRTTKPKRD